MSSLSPAFFVLPSLPTGSQASSQVANSSLTHHVFHPLSQNVELTKIDCCVLSGAPPGHLISPQLVLGEVVRNSNYSYKNSSARAASGSISSAAGFPFEIDDSYLSAVSFVPFGPLSISIPLTFPAGVYFSSFLTIYHLSLGFPRLGCHFLVNVSRFPHLQ